MGCVCVCVCGCVVGVFAENVPPFADVTLSKTKLDEKGRF